MDKYNKNDAKIFAANYRAIQADANTGELAWRRILPPRSVVGMRDGDQYVEEGQYKNWEESDYFGSESTNEMSNNLYSQPFQTLPEDHGNRAVVVGITPSASVYFRKKYFRSLAATAGWSRAFQAAMTNLMIQKSTDIATVEMLTKFRYMYGVRVESEGALTRDSRTNDPVGKEYNHYRMYWYGDNVGNYPGGILEVTNFEQLSTSLSIESADMGSCSIQMHDPYNLLYVSKRDIDRLFMENPDKDPGRGQKAAAQTALDNLKKRREELQKQLGDKTKTAPSCKTESEIAYEKANLEAQYSGAVSIVNNLKAQSAVQLKIMQDPNSSIDLVNQTAKERTLSGKALAEAERNASDTLARLNTITNNTAVCKPGEREKSEVTSTANLASDTKVGAQIKALDEEIAEAEKTLDSTSGDAIAQLKTGEFIYYKRDIDYLYQYVAGRSIFTVMDEVYIWMSPVKEDLFEFGLVDDLMARLKVLQGQSNTMQSETDKAEDAQDRINDCKPANQCKTQEQIDKEVRDLDSKSVVLKVEIGKLQSKLSEWKTLLMDPSIKDFQKDAIMKLLPQTNAALTESKKDLADTEVQIQTLHSQVACGATDSSKTTPADCSQEDIDGSKSAVSSAESNEYRKNAIKGEMDDIRGRLMMFGYSFDDAGNLLNESKVNTNNLKGFALTNGVQVFSGVVSSVSESWSDGAFTVTIGGSNNFKFLDMSRLTPCGSMVDSFGLLDSPVAMFKDKSGKMQWNWQWGIRVMSGLNAASPTIKEGESGYSMSATQSLAAGLSMKDRFYASFDSATLISTIICGVPWDVNLQLAMSIPDNDHAYFRSSVANLTSTPMEGATFTSQFRRIAGLQNAVLGNFVPFAWVPADILAYEIEQFSDKAIDHISDPNSASVASKQVNLIDGGAKKPLVTNDADKKIILDFIGVAGESTIEIKTVENLKNYKTEINRAIVKEGSLIGPQVPGRLDALKHENEAIDALMKAQPGQMLTPFDIRSIIPDYPKAADDPGGQLVGASECLTYRDAQNYLLMNRREDIVQNIDQTYVSIDMTYMASITARAFVVNMREGQEAMWKTERVSQRGQVKEIADQMDWELFADTQGNIIYRKRQFNRIPASVYKRKIVPYVAAFSENVLSEYGDDVFEWSTSDKLSWNQKEEQLVKYLPGIALSWVMVYQSAYLRAQLLEQDYPIEECDDELKYATELLYNSPVIHNSSDTSKQPRTRYHTYIMDEDIISWGFNENDAILTRVDVSGQWDMYKNGADATAGLPTALTGAAVDYDMWFHYGYRKEQITRAWLKDAVTQIPIYALTYLAHAKAKILSGTITVIGNPFFQQGEVVYIESRNMLYYVTKVAHSFSYGGDFRTTLTLEYGHFPGYWIADPYYLQSSMYGAGVVYTGTEALGSYEAMVKNRKAYQASLIAGASNLFDAGGNLFSDQQTSSTNALDLSNRTPPKVLVHSFDPVIVDRLRAARFFNDDPLNRGLDYEKIRRNERVGE